MITMKSKEVVEDKNYPFKFKITMVNGDCFEVKHHKCDVDPHGEWFGMILLDDRRVTFVAKNVCTLESLNE